MKVKSKVLSVALSAILAVTMFTPVLSYADDNDTAWQHPTQAMAVDNSIVKVGIHAAASTSSFFLGGNVVAERASDYSSITSAGDAAAQLAAAMKFTRLGAFGSSSNVSPDPYLWNYFYNLAVAAGAAEGPQAEDAVYISDGAGNPMASDVKVQDELGTSYTLARRPEVLMDKAGGYADLIAQLPENTDTDPANDYNPISLSYVANNFGDLVADMYNLSDAIKDSGKVGRYGDTEVIAEHYEAFMKGIQLYIMSKIADGTVVKKNVAVIDPTTGQDTDNDGNLDKFQLVDNTVSIGTSTDRPSESIMYISNNIMNSDVEKEAKEEQVTERGQTKTVTNYYASAQVIADYADVIIQAGHGSKTETEIRTIFQNAGVDLGNKPVYAKDPSDVFTIRANSVENFAGVGIFGGYLYPEVINPIYATMYIYENFWHLNKSDLVTFANANFANASLPAGIAADGAGYNGDEIQAMIDAGLQYYVDADLAAEYGETTLAPTERLTLPEKQVKEKKANPMKIKAVAKTAKYKTLKKKAVVVKGAVKFTKKAQGTVTYKGVGTNAKSKKALKINTKNGNITVKKKTKKGTYKMKVTVKAKGTANYKAATKTVTVSIKVK